MTAKEKYAARMKKLRDLHGKRNEGRKLNHQEVVEEDRRAKEPKNMEARKRRAEYILQEEEAKAKCQAEGRDWNIEKLRHLGANEADAIEKKKKAKQNPDEGFSSFENATFRKYGKLTAQIKPDMQVYDTQKAKAGDAFYATVGTVVHGSHKDTSDAIDKMAADVEQQKLKREKFSRWARVVQCSAVQFSLVVLAIELNILQAAPSQRRQRHRLHQRAQHEVQPEVRAVLRRLHQGHQGQPAEGHGRLRRHHSPLNIIRPQAFDVFLSLYPLHL
jgi:pre-mRNA-splicing factor SYF2